MEFGPNVLSITSKIHSPWPETKGNQRQMQRFQKSNLEESFGHEYDIGSPHECPDEDSISESFQISFSFSRIFD